MTQERPGRGLSAADLLRWLCCPHCRRDLELRPEAFFCAHCQRSYPIVLGIPDLRVYPDWYVPVEQDYVKARQLHEQVGKLDFAGLVDFYWEHISKPPTPLYLRKRFIRHTLSDEERVRRFPITEIRGGAFLDVGCGPGAMQKVANERFDIVFGTDIALRSLVVARKRLEEAVLPANMVCCCADYLAADTCSPWMTFQGSIRCLSWFATPALRDNGGTAILRSMLPKRKSSLAYIPAEAR